MNVKVTDSRDNKVYVGKLTTNIQIGQPIEVLLADGKHELHITNILRCLSSDGKYYIVDGDGIKFTLLLQ